MSKNLTDIKARYRRDLAKFTAEGQMYFLLACNLKTLIDTHDQTEYENACLKNDVSALRRSVKSENEALRSENDSLRAERVTLQDENCELGVKVGNLTKTNSRLAAWNNTQARTIQELRAEHVPKRVAPWPTPKSPTGRNPSQPNPQYAPVPKGFVDPYADLAATLRAASSTVSWMYGTPIPIPASGPSRAEAKSRLFAAINNGLNVPFANAPKIIFTATPCVDLT